VQSFDTFDGTWTASVRVTDDDGAQDEDTVTVERLVPPIAILLATPSFGFTPLDVELEPRAVSIRTAGRSCSTTTTVDNDGILRAA
jgi:hypothetical protein